MMEKQGVESKIRLQVCGCNVTDGMISVNTIRKEPFENNVERGEISGNIHFMNDNIHILFYPNTRILERRLTKSYQVRFVASNNNSLHPFRVEGPGAPIASGQKSLPWIESS